MTMGVNWWRGCVPQFFGRILAAGSWGLLGLEAALGWDVHASLLKAESRVNPLRPLSLAGLYSAASDMARHMCLPPPALAHVR